MDELSLEDLSFESIDVIPILTMKALFKVFNKVIENNEFEHEGTKYKIEFDYTDGL